MKSLFLHLIIALIVCVLALAGYGMWYSFISAKSASVTALQNKIDAQTEAVSRMNTTRAAFSEIAGDEAIVQSYFVPETGVVAFIDGLEARGRALGTTMNVLSVSTENSSTQPVLVFDLVVKGTFDAMMRTIGIIEYAPYAISIAALSVGQDTKDNWHANLKLLVGSVPGKTTTSTP